jgi:perosamine synthetase
VRIPFGRPLLAAEELAAVADVLKGNVLTHGPRVRAFEAAFAGYTGAPHAIGTASCMASLHLAYLSIQLGPGDEVLVPAQTHVAMAHAVQVCGARPVFVDAEPRTGNIDLDHAESLVSGRTRAISVVHYLGLPVDMDRVLDIGRRHDLFVVEDCATALGASFNDVHVGLHGDIGCFSFYPAKHITTGEGGMVITVRNDLAERVSRQRAFGIDKSVLQDRRQTGVYQVLDLGLNYRLGEVQAAIGVEQLKRLPEFLDARERNYRLLSAGLSEIGELELIESGHRGQARASFYCLNALVGAELAKSREQIIGGLKSHGVGTSIYYPQALPDTAYYRETYGLEPGSCPVATDISARSIAFPVGPHLTDSDIEFMVESVHQVIAEVVVHA